MADMISLDEARKKARPNYVDRAAIEGGCDLIEACVSEIARGSVEGHGGIDPIAYEINAHIVAIRRALEAQDVVYRDEN